MLALKHFRLYTEDLDVVRGTVGDAPTERPGTIG